MSGKRRSSARRPKVGIARRDGSQKKGKAGGDDTCGYPPPRRAVFAQRIRRGGSFQLPADTGCRQGRKGRGHGTPQARESRSIIIPPRHCGRSGTESAGRNPWPGPSNYHHRPPLKQKKMGGSSTPPGVSGLEGQGTWECPQLAAHFPVGTFVLVAPERAFAWPSWFSG